MKDFFISYNRADRAWAEWMPGTWRPRVLDREPGMDSARARTSPWRWTGDEGGGAWDRRPLADLPDLEVHRAGVAAYLAEDPTGNGRRLIPVRVSECEVDGLLRQVVYIDLVGTAEGDARQRLLDGVREGRAKPPSPPPFPGLFRGLFRSLQVPGTPPQATKAVTAGASLRLPGPPRCFGRPTKFGSSSTASARIHPYRLRSWGHQAWVKRRLPCSSLRSRVVERLANVDISFIAIARLAGMGS